MEEPARPAFPIGILRDLIRKWRFPRPGGTRPGEGGPRPDSKDAAERLRIQVGIVRRAFEEAGLPVSGGPLEGIEPPTDDADVHYLYRTGHALVRRRDFGKLEKYFSADENRERFTGRLEGRETRVPGLVLAALPARVDQRDDVLATLAELEESKVLERGSATPDHVVYVTPRGQLCPATEPETPRSRRATPWPPPKRSRTDVADKDRFRVSVVDTGLWVEALDSPESPWLEKSDVLADLDDVEVVDFDNIHPYAGHGTFVAGVISCLAPDTRVEVEGVLTKGGAVFELEIVEQLHQAINDDDHPHIISISAGTHTRDDFTSVAFEVLGTENKLAEREDVLIVAAAGNDSSNKPFWPAAFDWVVSVGSVDPDKKVSDFSNFGKDWVSIYARGRNLVNAFPKGTYTCHEPPNAGEVRQFDGLARWSGTSFSTPIVTGLIAAEMRDNGLTARAAWDVVRQTAIDFHDTRIGEDIKIVGPLT